MRWWSGLAVLAAVGCGRSVPVPRVFAAASVAPAVEAVLADAADRRES